MIRILNEAELSPELLSARRGSAADVESVVAEIIAQVIREGDAALYALTEKFDKVRLDALEVSQAEFDEAMAAVDSDFLAVLEEAANNIRAYHEMQVRKDFILYRGEGILLGQKITPIEKVGLYVPNGTAPYPSTVLMDSIPAKIAGCKELIMVTPPSRDGKVNPSILAAAKVAGIDRVFKVGGAQAVAALAYGTESIPAVYKIVGPGNAYVAEAKKQVYGKVAIDVVAGPSEVLAVSDGKADARVMAADLLSQAEHDVMSTVMLVTTSRAFAEAVAAEIDRQLSLLPREAIARAAVENNSMIIVTESIERAIDLANEIAPEHLELCLDEPFAWLDRVKNAGSIFLGKNCPEALGDYFAGPNHTLPTGGIAKFASPLSVDDFVKKSQFSYYTRDALSRAADKIALFARREVLEGHARSVLSRFEELP